MRHPLAGKILLKWKFQEYEKPKRDSRWFLWFGIICGLMLVYSLVNFNFLFALFIVFFIFLTFLHYNREPEKLDFAITENGLILHKEFLPYNAIDRFWMVLLDKNLKKVYFHKKKALNSVFSIPINRVDPQKVRRTLLTYLYEDVDQEGEPFLDYLGRILKI